MNCGLENKMRVKAIGLMSGTSLDGLDIAAVEFERKNDLWHYKLVHAKTIGYSEAWGKRLREAPNLSGKELSRLHAEYGIFTGQQCREFILKTSFEPDLIASHGHTVFHQPEQGYTLQIGNGASIATLTNNLTVADFRIGDVALGGQGAPLVPIGDKLLFQEYKYCLNLGGFANISFNKAGKRVAYDICPANFIFNHCAQKAGQVFDKDGALGRHGKTNNALFERLNQLEFYKKQAPKSLGREWVENEFFPALNTFSISDADKLRTTYEHIAHQISCACTENGKMLVTGGGAFNSFLIERIKQLCSVEITIPDKEVIDFKEALVFAFLGVLRVKGINNCLASVTGARKDSCGGVVFLP
jgi:anhydro-N-acetylmuramic acid kinase